MYAPEARRPTPPMIAPIPVKAKNPAYSAAQIPAATLPKPRIIPIIMII